MIVIDTHVMVWAMEDGIKLGARTRELLQMQSRTGRILISAITVWEIALLVQKGRLALSRDVSEWIDAALALPGATLAPREFKDRARWRSPAWRLPRRPRRSHDRGDRCHHSVPLLSVDRAILAYARAGHLQAIDASR